MRALAAAWLLACAAGGAAAQAPCPQAADVRQADLLGLWSAEFAGSGHVGTLLLEKHPEYAESFRGAIDRNGERRELAGDVDDGDVTLEESADGVHIAATWLGEVVDGSCAKEIRGLWTRDGETQGTAFVLRKR